MAARSWSSASGNIAARATTASACGCSRRSAGWRATTRGPAAPAPGSWTAARSGMELHAHGRGARGAAPAGRGRPRRGAGRRSSVLARRRDHGRRRTRPGGPAGGMGELLALARLMGWLPDPWRWSGSRWRRRVLARAHARGRGGRAGRAWRRSAGPLMELDATRRAPRGPSAGTARWRGHDEDAVPADAAAPDRPQHRRRRDARGDDGRRLDAHPAHVRRPVRRRRTPRRSRRSRRCRWASPTSRPPTAACCATPRAATAGLKAVPAIGHPARRAGRPASPATRTRSSGATRPGTTASPRASASTATRRRRTARRSPRPTRS